MSTVSKIASVQAIYLKIARPLGTHMGRIPTVNERGYIVDPDNGTIYPADDRTVILKITDQFGRVGWGETYGITAGKVIGELVRDVIAPLIIGRDPLDVRGIWRELYNLMRVRGYTNGFWLDALAAVDIALWDLSGKILGQPVYKLLGSNNRDSIKAYITNLPGTDNVGRLSSFDELYQKGFRAVKVHAASSFDYIALLNEIRGKYPDVELMLDLHWVHTSAEALSIIRKVEHLDLLFVEAPCKYEDVQGLARVNAASSIAIAGGEEWRTVHDAQIRLAAQGLTIVQPEMGRTGITQFMRIAELADTYHARVMPHATIGFGIFMAASLHASMAVENLPMHELQNTMFTRYAHLFETKMSCEGGQYRISSTPGLGIEPKDELWEYATDL